MVFTLCIIASAKEVMFSSAFVCLFVSMIMQKPLKLIFTKYSGKVAHRDFGGILDRITLGLELRARVEVWL